jgi:hypothetical protein
MTADTSAYAVLGLPPGADRDAIEQAYRRLIKRHHPDRAGGNNNRAAIYMRRAARDRPQRRKRPRRVPWTRISLVALLIAAFVWRAELAGLGSSLWSNLRSATEQPVRYRAGASLPAGDALRSELDGAAIRQAIGTAQRLIAAGDEQSLADASRDCHREFRLRPSAPVAMARKDPLRDEGPFSASAVTAREMSAGRMLSDDYLLIEARLDQVRGRVEAAVAPKRLAPMATKDVSADQAVRTDLPAMRPD